MKKLIIIALVSFLAACGSNSGSSVDQTQAIPAHAGPQVRPDGIVAVHASPQVRPVFASMTTVTFSNNSTVHFTNVSSVFR